MAYWIMRIEPADKFGPERAVMPIVEQISVRAALREPSIQETADVLARHGYELGPIVGTARAGEWPLTAYIYTSMRKDGLGRSASTLRRWPVRLR